MTNLKTEFTDKNKIVVTLEHKMGFYKRSFQTMQMHYDVAYFCINDGLQFEEGGSRSFFIMKGNAFFIMGKNGLIQTALKTKDINPEKNITSIELKPFIEAIVFGGHSNSNTTEISNKGTSFTSRNINDSERLWNKLCEYSECYK